MSTTNIPNPIRLGFDPNKSEEAIRTIFEDYTARTLWLSWKCGHVTSQYFAFSVWNSAQRIKAIQPPITEEDLCECMHGQDFQSNDVRRWAVDAIRFFNGSEEMKYTTPTINDVHGK